MADIEIASKLKANNGRGQNGDASASSTTKKVLPPIPHVSTPNASADAGDWQTRKISAAPITPRCGMESNGVGGSPSGPVPATTSSRKR